MHLPYVIDNQTHKLADVLNAVMLTWPDLSLATWTDVAIDQGMYRLYGLTEEEVRVVEGKAAPL